jgi:hypothetical protein
VKLNPKIDISDKFQSRIAAQALVYHGFDLKKAVAELRPDLKTYASFGARLLACEEVQKEISIIMNRTERNAQKFADLMWDWTEKELLPGPDGEISRADIDLKLTGARILAKGYITDKKAEPATKNGAVEKFVTELGSEAQNLIQ